ncbi:hypothetical protein [Halomonas nitroreducens]|uniref:Uncharacterized protein n=1 Tax=Halomonas nitroreducens TaxID=447425 RepID=A0A431V4E7_9GAMM|nr:hypothetical protein [Halomonas nitroreducens]RTR05083.1 hypothetical protein EKG36_08170 [Halomonas nitroreducens]
MPEDLLALANDHEHHEYHRYRWLSLRFLTYDLGISQLMQALAGESRQRVQALSEVAAPLSAETPCLRDPAQAAWQDRPLQPHFFIFADEVAAQELRRALLEEHRSYRFYKCLRACHGIAGLDGLLDAFVEQARAQCTILEETQDQLPALPRAARGVGPRDAAIHRRRRLASKGAARPAPTAGSR